jgi:hypothetical protein
MKRITLISRFSTSELSGHALLDDERYFDFLSGAGANFRLYTSRYSFDRILGKHPENQRYLSAIEDTPINLESNSKVIFIGYSELDVVIFLARNMIHRPRLILVATNNFSTERVKRRRLILKLFLRIVRPYLSRLVLHTAYEQQLVAGLDPEIAKKSFVKKHHLMTPYELSTEAAGEATIVSYYGPEKRDKPIEPFLELIEADIERRFKYRIHNVNLAALTNRFPDLIERSNVEVFEEWQSHSSYLKSVKGSMLLFLTHTRSFEGKLSGNLCDCIALRVPYIAREMEPMTSYEAQYGPLGYLVDLEDKSWATRFLETYSDETYATMCRNLKRLGDDHSKEAINSDLIACLLN